MSGTKLFVLLAMVLSLSASLSYDSKTNKTVADGQITNVRFSADQSFMAALVKTKNKVIIFNGFTLEELQTITATNTTIDPQSVAFSSDNLILAFGDQNGNVFLHGRNGTMFSNDPYNSTTLSTPSGVISLAFSNNNAMLAIGDVGGIITLYDVPAPTAKKQTLFGLRTGNFKLRAGPIDFATKINSLAFGPSTGNLLVGGGDTGAASLKIYDAANDFAELISITPASLIQGVSYSQDEAVILTTGNDGLVNLRNDQLASTAVLTPDGAATNILYEVLISNNKLYVVAVGNTLAYSWSRPDDASSFTARAGIPSSLNNIAFGKASADLIVISDDGAVQEGVVQEYSLCPTEQFYDQTDVCNPCNVACDSCYATADQCYGCKPKNFLDNTQCKTCIPGCNACTDGATCTDCDATENWSLVGDICQCVPRFFQEGTECKSCVIGCLNCTEETACQACDTTGNFELNVTDNTCKCIDKFFLNVNLCQACGIGCIVCNATECEACEASEHFIPDAGQPDCVCDDSQNWVLSGTECICKKGYYDSLNETCDSCKTQCTACESFTNCTECLVATMTLSDGVCKCPRGQFFDGVAACGTCTIVSCLDCDTATECIECDAASNRQLNDDNTQCVCMKTFFDNAGVCTACTIPGCDRCDSTTVCTGCSNEGHWNLVDNTCKCADKFLEVANLCAPCGNAGCLKCEPDVDTCTQCNDADKWVKNGNTCVCREGTFFDLKSSCLKCENGCKICEDGETCTTCYEGGHYKPKDNNCFCEPHYWNATQQECQECSMSGCDNCTAADICTDCLPDFEKKGDLCDCNATTYPDGNKCVGCEAPCLQCSTRTSCDKCEEGYQLDNQVCSKGGLSTLVIVLIVVGGLALIGAVFAGIKFFRKKKSPLEEEGDYEPVE